MMEFHQENIKNMEGNALTFRNLEAKATSASNEINKIFLPILPDDELVKSVSIDIETIMPLDMSISMAICNSLAIILKSTIFSELSVPVILVGIIKYFALSPLMTLANSQQLQAVDNKKTGLIRSQGSQILPAWGSHAACGHWGVGRVSPSETHCRGICPRRGRFLLYEIQGH